MEFKDSYTACAYFEGFCEGEGASPQQQLEALAYLIKTREVWKLQGFYGRSAAEAIREGLISENGEVLADVSEMC